MNYQKMQEPHIYKKLLDSSAFGDKYQVDELRTAFSIRLHEARIWKSWMKELNASNIQLEANNIISFWDHMTMNDFINTCKWGCFIDYDWFWYYATANRETRKVVKPSNVLDWSYDTSFTHVVWYNR